MKPSLVIPAAALTVLHAIALLAEFVAPYRPHAQHREHAWSPPAHFGLEGTRLVVTQRKSDGSDEPSRLIWFTHADGALRLFRAEAGHVFLLGTDGLGRDQFSRFVHGARLSLFTGLFAALLASLAGIGAGLAAGYGKRLLDGFVMRLSDLFIALPWMYLLLATRAFFPLNTHSTLLMFATVGLLGLVGWARPARLVRNVVLEVKEREYVLAARGFGAGHAYILRRHIWPEVLPTAVTWFSLAVPQYVFAETTLSFLGLGPGGDVVSWGQLVASVSRLDVIENYWWMPLPLALLIAVFGCYAAVTHALTKWHAK
jgi:peptide/nickel transport system permease protein